MTTTTTSTSRHSSSRSAASTGSASVDLTVASGSTLHLRCSTRADGDFHPRNVPAGELEARRRTFVDHPWTMLDQHHGTTVVRVDAPGVADSEPGDIAIVSCGDAVIGCWVADCAPLVLVGEREFGVVHAGWRGLAAGVIDIAIDALDGPVRAAVLGPCIGACCYEFGEDDLASVAAGVHAAPGSITGSTTEGAVALDVAAAVRAGCGSHGLALRQLGGCTGCTFDGFSHRVRRDLQRHVVAAWTTS